MKPLRSNGSKNMLVLTIRVGECGLCGMEGLGCPRPSEGDSSKYQQGSGWIWLDILRIQPPRPKAPETFGPTRSTLHWPKVWDRWICGKNGFQRSHRHPRIQVWRHWVLTKAGKSACPSAHPPAAGLATGGGGRPVAAAGPFGEMVGSLERAESVLSTGVCGTAWSASARWRAVACTRFRTRGRHPGDTGLTCWLRWNQRSPFFPSDPPLAEALPATRDGAPRSGAQSNTPPRVLCAKCGLRPVPCPPPWVRTLLALTRREVALWHHRAPTVPKT